MNAMISRFSVDSGAENGRFSYLMNRQTPSTGGWELGSRRCWSPGRILYLGTEGSNLAKYKQKMYIYGRQRNILIHITIGLAP